MKRAFLGLALVAALAATAPAQAEIGRIEAIPGATLLLPYFEVDLANPSGTTTLFSINNASATAILAHVTVWSDLSVPTLAFNVYLTGYDVQTINVRDIFLGTIPRTGSAGQDPTDTISPKGSFSQDINFASCSGILPPPPLPANYIDHIAKAHTGVADPFNGGLCSGVAWGDTLARGYITVDTVNNCTLRAANDPIYFATDVTFQNVLWGDVFWINPGLNFAHGDTLVSIEASTSDPKTTVAGNYTFYGRYVNWTAADHREPLPTNFTTRFLNGGLFSGGTSLIVWRDPKVSQLPFTCPATVGRPSWYPLNQEGYRVFDEQEHAFVPPTPVVWPPPPPATNVPFATAAERTQVGGTSLPVPYTFGWIYLNLNTTVTGVPNPPVDPAAAQAWVHTSHDANGRFSVGIGATALDSGTAPLHFFPH